MIELPTTSRQIRSLVTTENYSQLFRSKDVEGYTSFFTENYVDGQ